MKFVSHFAVKKYAHLKRRTAPAMLAGVALLFATQTARAQENDHQKNDEDREATPITTCPTTIGKSGEYFLANDLQGCTPFGISITVSDVAVELRGHTIQAVSTGNVPGDVAILANVGTTALSHLEIEGPGTLTQGDTGIYFGNVHYSRVRNLVAVQNNTGIAVNASNLTSDAMIAATASTNNEFSNNVITSNFFHGITVNGGNENRFIRNNLSGNLGGNGLYLFNAKNNVARENTADANFLSGIDIAPLGSGSSGNLVEGNTALGNTTDLVDQNGDCTHNTWTNNSFSSKSPPCIL